MVTFKQQQHLLAGTVPTELSRVPDAPLDVQYGNLRLNANDIVDASKVTREKE